MAVTPLTLYGTRINAGTLPTANTLATAPGGVLSSNNVQLGMHYGYGEVYSQGTASAWPENYFIGAPSGHGWLLDSPLLEGMQTLLGAWSASVRLSVTADGTILTADIYMRLYRRSAAGMYTPLGQFISRNQTITGAPTLYAMVPRNLAATVFKSGDKLYIDVSLNILTNTSTSPLTQLTTTLAQTSLGVVGSQQVGTPGYLPEPTLDVSTRLLLQRLMMTRDLAYRLRILATQAQDMSSRVMLGTAYSKLVMGDNAYVYYRLGDKSGTTAHEETFHSCDGVASGGVTFGQPGAIVGDNTTSMLFDGSTGYVTLPVRIRPETWTTFTVECWFNLSTAVFSTSPTMISSDWTSGHSRGFQLGISTNASYLEFDVSNGTQYQAIFYYASLSANSWYHFSATYDGSIVSGYLNGVLFANVAFVGPLAASPFPITIGGFPSLSTYFFPGRIQEVALYTSALSAAQVLANYLAGGYRVRDITTRLLLQ